MVCKSTQLYTQIIKTLTNPTLYHHHHQQCRSMKKVRLKWVKNRFMDHIIDLHTDLKAAQLVKNAIIRSPSQFITSKTVEDTQKIIGLTIPTLRFIRRYPTLFREFPHPNYPSLKCFDLTDVGIVLHKEEMRVYAANEGVLVEKLCRLLMMCKGWVLPLKVIHPFKWDLGLPDDFDKRLVGMYPDRFRVERGANGLECLRLVEWVDDFAVSELQKSIEFGVGGDEYRRFRTGESALAFTMSFPRGYGVQKKVKAWMDEFQKLPYISPYEDSGGIDPKSDLMEKRVVGVLHELLSLTVYKKTQRNYLRSMVEELNLPERFTRIFTRYPGIFYLSLKCQTTTVALKEGYSRGKLVKPCPLARLRGKFHYVMRTGLMHRNKGLELLSDISKVADHLEDGTGEGEYEEDEASDDCYEGGSSELEDESDEN